jgi:uncharacterized delta-60 repeat protein
VHISKRLLSEVCFRGFRFLKATSGSPVLPGIFALLALSRVSQAGLLLSFPNTLERQTFFPNGIRQITALPNDEVMTSSRPFVIMPDGGVVTTGDDTHCLTLPNAPAVSPNDYYLFNVIVRQPDGKFLVGCDGPANRQWGSSIFEGVNRGLFRLNSDGSVDESFKFAAEHRYTRAIRLLSDGKILIGGNYNSVFRLMPDGEVDATFNLVVDDPRYDSFIQSVAIQPDGKLVVAGSFRSIGGVPRPGLARLYDDGSLDFDFAPPADKFVLIGAGLTILPNGDILVPDPGYRGVARFLPDGKLHATITDPAITDPVHLAVGSDGRIYMANARNLFQFSGPFRVTFSWPESILPITLERSANILGPWTALKTVPAGSVGDYPDYDFPGTGRYFYRIKP